MKIDLMTRQGEQTQSPQPIKYIKARTMLKSNKNTANILQIL